MSFSISHQKNQLLFRSWLFCENIFIKILDSIKQQVRNNQCQKDIKGLSSKESPDVFGILFFEYVTKISFKTYANKRDGEKNLAICGIEHDDALRIRAEADGVARHICGVHDVIAGGGFLRGRRRAGHEVRSDAG